MKAEQLAVVQGWDDTRATLRRWNADPSPVARSAPALKHLNPPVRSRTPTPSTRRA